MMIGHETGDGRSFPRHSDLTPTEIDEVNQPKMLVIILESLPIMMVTQPVVHSRSESGPRMPPECQNNAIIPAAPSVIRIHHL